MEEKVAFSKNGNVYQKLKIQSPELEKKNKIKEEEEVEKEKAKQHIKFNFQK